MGQVQKLGTNIFNIKIKHRFFPIRKKNVIKYNISQKYGHILKIFFFNNNKS
jgi:hypothetical protein